MTSLESSPSKVERVDWADAAALQPHAAGFTLPIAITPQLTLWRLVAQGSSLLYEGFDRRSGARVAVKVVAHARDASVRTRILQDAALHANLEHPNIAPILDVASLSDGTPYLVVEFVSGQTLAEVMASARPSRALACEVTSHLLGALIALHRAGLVHGHLAPGHVFLQTTPSGSSRVLLLDTGFARDRPLGAAPSDSDGPALQYAAPEQLVAGEWNARSDLYALGLLLHEMLTGVCPHTGLAPAELISARVRAEIDDVHLVRAGVGSTLSRFVLTALERDPSARFVSAEEMLCELHAARADESCLWKHGSQLESAAPARFVPTEPILPTSVAALASLRPPQSPLDSAIWTPQPQLAVAGRRGRRGGLKTWLTGFGVTLVAGAALLVSLDGAPTPMAAVPATAAEPLASTPTAPAPVAASASSQTGHAAVLGQAAAAGSATAQRGAADDPVALQRAADGPVALQRATDGPVALQRATGRPADSASEHAALGAAQHAAAPALTAPKAADGSGHSGVLEAKPVASAPGQHPQRVAKKQRGRSDAAPARSRVRGEGQPSELPANPY